MCGDVGFFGHPIRHCQILSLNCDETLPPPMMKLFLNGLYKITRLQNINDFLKQKVQLKTEMSSILLRDIQNLESA